MARPKVAYHGAYPAGFLERARALLGVHIEDAVLHVCGGKVRDYPYPERAVGPNDRTVDLDPACSPDFLTDVRHLGVEKGDTFVVSDGEDDLILEVGKDCEFVEEEVLWPAALIDRPYTEEDHTNYAPDADEFPSDLNDLLKRTLSLVRPGGRVGVLDYLLPRPPKKLGDNAVKFVAAVAVIVGFNNRIRCFSVFERVAQA